MNTVTAETLSPITHGQIRVITTELLAKLYQCSVECIHRNHHRNKVRFTEGKHFVIAKGVDLQNLKISLRDFQTVAPNVRKLILWTERGAARHAKMLETDQAWEVFEKLEDCYFGSNTPAFKPMTCSRYDSRTLCYKRNGVTINEIPLRDEELVITLESWVQLAQNNGWIVMRQDELIDKLVRGIESSLVRH